MVVRGVGKIQNLQPFPNSLPVSVAKGNLHSGCDEVIFFAVGRQHCLAGNRRGDLAYSIVISGARQARVELLQGLAQVTSKHNLFIRIPPQGSVRAIGFGVVGVYGVPAELAFKVFGSGLLDEGVFVVGNHSSRAGYSVFLCSTGINPYRPSSVLENVMRLNPSEPTSRAGGSSFSRMIT